MHHLKCFAMKQLLSLSIIVVFIGMCTAVSGQTIKGVVVSDTKEPLAGAAIQRYRTKAGVAADENGKFAYKPKSFPDTILVVYVGYETKKVVLTKKMLGDSLLTVVLKRSAEDLEDVVVTGFATVSKKDMVGATTSVAAKDMVYDKSYVAPVSAMERKVSAIKARGISSGRADDATPAIASDVSVKSTMPLADSRPAKSKLLTAGEVNDFNKWKRWNDFAANDFKTYSEHWRLYPLTRYCVQMQYSSRLPAVNKKVYLINTNTNDTVWTAVSDNTGKAELWASIHKHNDEQARYQYIIAFDDAPSINRPYEFENGINKVTLTTPCNTKKQVDVAFVVDATGSMADEIEYLKVELEDILHNAFDRYSDYEMKSGAVFYRDHGDQYLTRHQNFDKDVKKLMNFIAMQKADGGGDSPEAVDAALNTALDSLSWNPDASARLLFLVLDAPPHDEAKEKMFVLTAKAAAKGIRIIPVICSGADKSTEFIMRSIALATNGTYVFLTDDSGIGNAHMKPTTDSYTVELLNDLLSRLIQQMIYVNTCSDVEKTAEPITKIPSNVLEIKVSPNPTHGEVSISSNKDLKDVFVTDFTGKILMRLTAREKNKKIDIGEYPSGTYVVKYLTEDNQWGAEKIILVH